MGIISLALRPRPPSTPVLTSPQSTVSMYGQQPYAGGTYARHYAGNEIVNASVNLLSTSAAEPHIIGRHWRRNSPQVRAEARRLKSLGVPNNAGAKFIDAALIRNGFIEDLVDHPAVELLNNPNPFVSRGAFWGDVTMDYYLAGNAYLLKLRSSINVKNNVLELWRLRPDRMKVIPARGMPGQIEAYEYGTGSSAVRFPASDIVHFKTRNPLDDYYGMPPLMPISARVATDNQMREFVRTFYERNGTGPGAIISGKGSVGQQQADYIKERYRAIVNVPTGWMEPLVLGNVDGLTFTQLGLNRGLRDALPKEIDAMNEARIAMVFGIPGSILGLLIGYESSSYANKRQDWQVLWDVTMTPLLSDFDDVLNLALIRPDFTGIDEVLFDLSDIRALQEDIDALHDRARKNFATGGWSFEEFREATGKDPKVNEGMFFVPSAFVPTPIERLGEEPEEPEPAEPAQLMARAVTTMIEARIGRPRVEEDAGARAIYDEAMAIREAQPRLSWEQIAVRVGVVERTLRRYRDIFDDED